MRGTLKFVRRGSLSLGDKDEEWYEAQAKLKIEDGG